MTSEDPSHRADEQGTKASAAEAAENERAGAAPATTQPLDDDRESDPHDPTSELLRRALHTAPLPPKSLLPKIQERIRVRTRGRYYRDRWSRSRDPVPLILMAALLLLIITAFIYLVLQPLMGGVSHVTMPAAPADPMRSESTGLVPGGSRPSQAASASDATTTGEAAPKDEAP